MSFFLYYIFQFLLAVGIIILFIFLLKKIIFDKQLIIKLISLLGFLILINLPVGKNSLDLVNVELSTYRYQNCESNFHRNVTQFEHKWCNKQELQTEMEVWHEQYHRVESDTLYRTFDFKWWMFWEYYTYYSTDVYQLPLLPDTCKKLKK